jgi:hypothetical protein
MVPARPANRIVKDLSTLTWPAQLDADTYIDYVHDGPTQATALLPTRQHIINTSVTATEPTGY